MNKKDIQAATGCACAAVVLMFGVFPLIGNVLTPTKKLGQVSMGLAAILAAVLVTLFGIITSISSQIGPKQANMETVFLEVSPAMVRTGLAMSVLGYFLAAATGLTLLFIRYDKVVITGKETQLEVNELWGTFGFTAAIIALLAFPASVFTNLTTLL